MPIKGQIDDKAESNPLISILMPVKNAEIFLNECIDSIINQAEGNWELIAINDHSSDSSFEILTSYSRSDSRIKAIQNKGNGIIRALRTALKCARGSLITRMDADDIMTMSKLKILKKNILQAGEGSIAVGGVRYFSNDELGEGYKKYALWLNGLTSKGDNFKEIYKECVIPSPCWMLHKSDLVNCEAFDSDIYPEDYDLCFRFYKNKLRVTPCVDILHLWRDHQERSSRNLPEYSDNFFLVLKLKYFVTIDYDVKKRLIIWGAGKKGKKVAASLQEKGIAFTWVCNNSKKIGRDIYGITLENPKNLNLKSQCQVLIVVANQKDKKMISVHPAIMTKDSEVFHFC
ncbi:MAG: glycosyltransferase family 2 protein [Saprospiraceae bacterium]